MDGEWRKSTANVDPTVNTIVVRTMIIILLIARGHVNPHNNYVDNWFHSMLDMTNKKTYFFIRKGGDGEVAIKKVVSNGYLLIKEKKVVIRYNECRRNHAANIGKYAVDGCCEFMAAGEEGAPSALKCAACSCHRNFHRRSHEINHIINVCYSSCDHHSSISMPPN